MFPILTAEIGTTSTFWLFGLSSLLALVFINRLVPETKGRSLEAIEDDLRNSVSLVD